MKNEAVILESKKVADIKPRRLIRKKEYLITRDR